MAEERERSFPSRNNKPGESPGDVACPRCRKVRLRTFSVDQPVLRSETKSCYVSQDVFELTILLPQHPHYWDYGRMLAPGVIKSIN